MRYSMKKIIELPEDFIEITKESTDYNMPNNYNSNFVEEKVLIWTQKFYELNGLGEYLKDLDIDTMKSVHIYKDMLIK